MALVWPRLTRTRRGAAILSRQVIIIPVSLILCVRQTLPTSRLTRSSGIPSTSQSEERGVRVQVKRRTQSEERVREFEATSHSGRTSLKNRRSDVRFIALEMDRPITELALPYIWRFKDCQTGLDCSGCLRTR